MNFSYCSQCGKETAHKRALGMGTLIACLFTCGLWLPALFLYPVRCIHCGREESEPAEELDNSPAPFQEKESFKKKSKMVLRKPKTEN